MPLSTIFSKYFKVDTKIILKLRKHHFKVDTKKLSISLIKIATKHCERKIYKHFSYIVY